MDNKKIQTIDKIYRLTQQDAEFYEELKKKLGIDSSSKEFVVNDERIDEIYEYCIEKIIHRQAEEFYQDFPIKSIIPTLVEDYVRMESFRRKNDFGDFCLSLYQQIECISNRICESSILDAITGKMWAYPAYVVPSDKGVLTLENRLKKKDGEDYLIAHLIFSKNTNPKTGNAYAVEKSKVTLQNQYAMDKVRIIVYYFGFKAMLTSSDYKSYVEITGLLNDIYQCRNTNHRGNTVTAWEQKILDRVVPMKSLYYFKFLGALAQFVEFVKEGTPYIQEIKKYADTLSSKSVPIPALKSYGKIELSKQDLNKRRFK